MKTPNQELLASSKAPNQYLRTWRTLQLQNFESQNLDEGSMKTQEQKSNHDQDTKFKSGTSNILTSPNQDLKDTEDLRTFKIRGRSKLKQAQPS